MFLIEDSSSPALLQDSCKLCSSIVSVQPPRSPGLSVSRVQLGEENIEETIQAGQKGGLQLWVCSMQNLFIFLKMLIDWYERQREEAGGEREREMLICCSTHPCTHWLIPPFALTQDQTRNLGVSGWHSFWPTELSGQGHRVYSCIIIY